VVVEDLKGRVPLGILVVVLVSIDQPALFPLLPATAPVPTSGNRGDKKQARGARMGGNVRGGSTTTTAATTKELLCWTQDC